MLPDFIAIAETGKQKLKAQLKYSLPAADELVSPVSAARTTVGPASFCQDFPLSRPKSRGRWARCSGAVVLNAVFLVH